MNIIQAALSTSVICALAVGGLIVVWRYSRWRFLAAVCNLGVLVTIAFLLLLFIGQTFGHNSYDRRFNYAFTQYFTDPTVENKALLDKETKRKRSDELVTSVVYGTVLVLCIVLSWHFRKDHPNKVQQATAKSGA